MLLLALLDLVNTTAVIVVGRPMSTTGLKPLPVDLKPPRAVSWVSWYGDIFSTKSLSIFSASARCHFSIMSATKGSMW